MNKAAVTSPLHLRWVLCGRGLVAADWDWDWDAAGEWVPSVGGEWTWLTAFEG